MLPKYLKIHGYRSYIDETISFNDFGEIFCIVGENGAGKSSIIDMITTALYWKNPSVENSNTTMDDLINSSCDYFELEYDFTMSGHEYLIKTRKKVGKSRELEFYIDNISQTEKVTETQKKILDVIKLDYDVFLDTICIGQGNSAHFMNKSPNERKETLAQILDLKRYDLYEKIAKEKRKAIQYDIDKVSQNIDFISSRLPDVNALQHEIDYKEEQNNTLHSDLMKYQEEYDTIMQLKREYDLIKEKNNFILNQRDMLSREKKNLELQVKNLSNELANIVVSDMDYEVEILEQENKIDEYKNRIHDIKNKITEYKTQNTFYNKNQTTLQTQYNSLLNYNKTKCEFCGNMITAEHKEQHLTELKKQQLELQKLIKNNEDLIEDLKIQGNNISQLGKKASQERDSLKQLHYKNEENKKKIQLKRQQFLNYKQQLQNIEKQYNDNLLIEITPIENKVFNENELKQKCKNIQNEIQKNDYTISVNLHEIEQAKLHEQELKKLEERLKELEIESNDYKDVVTAFGKKGIQKSIIMNDLPLMEKNINSILAKISDNSMTIEFIVSKQNKKDSDTLDIIVNDSNVSRNYDTYSGGERFRLDFACHVGLAKFLAGRVGASIDFFVIDEGLGSQDDSAKQKFIESINSLKGLFKQVMVITHIQDLQNSFENRVLIEKDQLKGSKVTLLR